MSGKERFGNGFLSSTISYFTIVSNTKIALIIRNPKSDPLMLKANALPNWDTNSFYMIKNLSDVNSCQYEVMFTGLRKPIVKQDTDDAEMTVLTA